MRLNTTITSLVAASLVRGGWYAIPGSSTQRCLSLLNSHFSRSFDPLLFSQSFNEALTVNRCSFSKFLAPSIALSSVVHRGELFSSTFTSDDASVTIENCRFIECHSNLPGSAIHLEVPECELSVAHTLFHVCRCLAKGGAMCVSMRHMSLKFDCFHLCRCGKENGNDGSAVYAWSATGTNTSYVSAFRCPRHGDQCWYGIIILCNGALDSRNINMSNSDVEFIAGLAHFRPVKDQSVLLYYTSVNELCGNALAFIDFSFPGRHQFGSICNDTSKSGIFYIQNTTTTLENYFFMNNRGSLVYSYAQAKATFVDCVFSGPPVDLGHGFGDTINCRFNAPGATTLDMAHLNTAYCDGNVGQEGQEVVLPQLSGGGSMVGVLLIAVAVVGASGYIMWKRVHRKFNFLRRRK
jgi:hypothetical protein